MVATRAAVDRCSPGNGDAPFVTRTEEGQGQGGGERVALHGKGPEDSSFPAGALQPVRRRARREAACQRGGHHISTEHRLRRKQFNSNTNASNKTYLKEIQEKRKEETFFLREKEKKKKEKVKKKKKKRKGKTLKHWKNVEIKIRTVKRNRKIKQLKK